MSQGRPLSPYWTALAVAGIICLPLAGVPLIAAPETGQAKPPKPTRWERLQAKIVVKDAEYAGAETCALVGCHGDTVKSWTALPHSQHILQAKEWSEDERSCEGCHGPGSAHLTDKQHGAIARLSEHPDYVAALCTRCHHEDVQEAHFRADVHASVKVSCGTCHDVHRDHGSVSLLRGGGARALWLAGRERKPKRPAGSGATTSDQQPPGEGTAPPAAGAPEAPPAAGPKARLDRGTGDKIAGARFLTDQAKVNTLCLSCHQQQQGQFHQNSRHPLFEGRITCTDCHNPHGTGETTLVRHRVDALCVRCHTEKRGPFAFEHDTLTTGDGCLTCHQAHGSPNNKLVKLNGRAVCLQCHSEINAEPAHRTRPGSCWRAGCHADFHGSNTDERFLHAGVSGSSLVSAASLRSPAPDRTPSVVERQSEFARLLALLAQTTAEEPEAPLSSPPAVADARLRASAAAAVADERPDRILAAAENAPSAGTAAGTAPSGDGKASAAAASLRDLEVIGSYQNLGVDGNRSKFYQYTVPPSGLFLQRLRLGFRDRQGQPTGFGEWTGLDEPRQTAALRLGRLDPLGRGSALRYSYDRAAFFIEPSLEPVVSSDRRTQALRYRWVPTHSALELRLRGDTQRVEAPGVSRLAVDRVPGSINYAVERFGPELRLPAGSGNLGIQFSRENFEDRTGAQPDAHVNLWRASYDGMVGLDTSVFASFTNASLRQDGLPGDTENRLARIGISHSIFRNLTASAQLDIQNIRKPNTFNAFVRDRDLFVTRLRYRPWTRWMVEGGYERTGLRRVNNPQTLIETPRWDGGWLALRVLPTDNITFSARHTIRRLSHAPPAVITELPSTLPLYYDKDDRTDAQLSIGLPANVLLYFNYGRDRRQNNDRQVGFLFDTWDAGVTLPLSGRLSFNADWSRQNWEGRGEPLTEDPLRLNFGQPMTSDGTAFNFGFAYLSGRDTLTLNLYRFTASGGEALRSQGIALGFEPRWVGWLSPRFQVGWDDYNDHVFSGFNNSDAFFRIDLGRRF
jgi:predicted CXXCH cytochrome family protein